MKRKDGVAGVLVMGVLMAAGVARAQSEADKDFFKKQIGALVEVDPTPVTGALEIAKVFDGSFYSVQVTIAGNISTMVAARSGDALVLVDKPSTTADMPGLVKLVKPGFKLGGDADGKAFEAALDAIYPIDTTFNKDNLKAKAIRHKGDEWTFIRGKFFEHFEGFVVTTKADGTITGIKYSLDIP